MNSMKSNFEPIRKQANSQHHFLFVCQPASTSKIHTGQKISNNCFCFAIFISVGLEIIFNLFARTFKMPGLIPCEDIVWPWWQSWNSGLLMQWSKTYTSAAHPGLVDSIEERLSELRKTVFSLKRFVYKIGILTFSQKVLEVKEELH